MRAKICKKDYEKKKPDTNVGLCGLKTQTLIKSNKCQNQLFWIPTKNNKDLRRSVLTISVSSVFSPAENENVGKNMENYSLTDEHTISRISDNAPRAMSAYFLCLHNADGSGFVSFTRDFIINHVSTSWTKFKNDIRALSRLFIVTFDDMGDSIEISLINPEDYDNRLL